MQVNNNNISHHRDTFAHKKHHSLHAASLLWLCQRGHDRKVRSIAGMTSSRPRSQSSFPRDRTWLQNVLVYFEFHLRFEVTSPTNDRPENRARPKRSSPTLSLAPNAQPLVHSIFTHSHLHPHPSLSESSCRLTSTPAGAQNVPRYRFRECGTRRHLPSDPRSPAMHLFAIEACRALRESHGTAGPESLKLHN